MTRRGFLRGLVATAAWCAVPASVVQALPALTAPARDYAVTRLAGAYHAYVVAHTHPPEGIRVGRDLYEMYEGELLPDQRFVSGCEALMFKGAPVVPAGRGYGVEVVGVLEYALNTTGVA